MRKVTISLSGEQKVFPRSIYLLAFVLFIGFRISAQAIDFEPVIYNFTTEHGLPSLETYSVNQDSKGYIWITSDAGVSRYDGFKFETFTTDDGLTDNVVFDSYEDYKGRIWFLTYNSLLCYYENGKIHQYKYNYKIKELVHEDLPTKSLIIDSNDNFYYSLSYMGMYKIDKNGKYNQLHQQSSSYFTKSIHGDALMSFKLIERKPIIEKNIVIAYESVLFNGKYPKGKSSTSSYYKKFEIPKSKFNLQNNYALFEDKIYDIKRNQIVFSGNDLISLKIIDSTFWICTLKGLIKTELKADGYLKQTHCYFPEMQFTNICKLENCFMMTTIENGVIVCEDFDFLKINENSGLINGAILSITSLNEELIVSNSLKIQNIVTAQTTNLGAPVRSSKKVAAYKDLLVTFCSFSIIDYKEKFSNQLNANFLRFGYIANFKFYENELYWVSDALSCFNFETKKYSVLYDSWKDNSTSRQRFIKDVVKLPDGTIYIGNVNGIFEVQNKQLIPVRIGELNLKVVALEYNETFGLVIGTTNKGVYCVKNDKISHYNVSNGLLSNKVNTIRLDNTTIYVGSANGLNALHVKGKHIENVYYSTNNFYENIDVNVIFLKDGWIYLGTGTGLMKLKKDRLVNVNNRKRAKLSLKKIEIDGENNGQGELIDFPYSANLLKIDFAVFQYCNFKGKRYQYRVNSDGQWVSLESPSISMYRPVGNFNIEVRYLNPDFSWSVPQKICSVSVHLPFWQRWYFWSLIMLVVLLLLFLYYQRSQKRALEKLVISSQMLSLEQQMENARMNPHFIFNVLNSIHSYMLNEETEKADVYLMKFSKLMREILGSTKEGVIKLSEEISILNKYLELEQLRFNRSFEFLVHMEGNNIDVSIPSMMIQPFVENAVLYSKQIEGEATTDIIVHFELQSSSILKATITNPGMPSLEAQDKINDVNTKNAIGITRKRLENYNKLFNTSDYGVELLLIEEKSTKIELKIPIIKN